MKQKLIFSAIFSSIILFSCADAPDKAHEKNTIDEELRKEAQEPRAEHEERAYYPIPSPEQMFGFINDNGVAYSKDLMNAPDKASSYTDPTVKALNFGVYTADLAYCASYQDIESTLDLYKVVKTIGAELNIEEMMTEEMMNNMQAHLQDKDSLAIIAGQSYYQAVDYLEQNQQEGKLALMSLGGWVESLYITLNAIKDFDENSSTAQRLADQKITFGNLYTYLRKNEEEIGVPDQLKAIQGIRSVFASLREKKVAKASNAKEGGKLVLGGGTKISINTDQFNALKKAINEYRNSITK